jgi:glycosyltransferase involved in cell wall biosynthesis
MVAKISACLIVRNEENNLEQCINSFRPYVDELVIVDTGSSDKTPEIAKKYADKFEVYRGCNDDEDRIEDFSKARQRALNLTSNPWVFWVDGDDRVDGAANIPAILASVEAEVPNPEKPIQVFINYEYGFDAEGNCVCIHQRERFIRHKDSFNWLNPVHEVLVAKPNVELAPVWRLDSMKIVHHRTGKVSSDPTRNLRILKKWYEKHGETDPRQLYYLGMEFSAHGFQEEALSILKRYVRLSGFEDEKCLALILIAQLHRGRQELNEAIEYNFKAVNEKETWFEPLYDLMISLYMKASATGSSRDWERCVYFGEQAMAKGPTHSMLFINPMDRRLNIHRYLNFAYNKVNRVQEALRSCDQALQVAPNDRGIVVNRAIYKSVIEVFELRKRTVELYQAIKVIDNIGIRPVKQELIEQLGDLLGIQLRATVTEQKIEVKTPSYKEQKLTGKLDIVFWTGQGVEWWSPKTLATGLGGSETAVVYTAKILAAKGHAVKVYCDCPEMEGVYDGVEYKHFGQFAGDKIDCDVLISSRQPWVMDIPFRAGLKLLWIHDVHCGAYNIQMQRWLLKFDAFLVLSDWHRDFVLETYPCLNPDAVIKTANGIDHQRFKKIEKRTNKLVYSSSLDRGLDNLLVMFPKIRERVPDAELHVYYGFDWWEKFTALNGNPQSELARIEAIKQALKQPGVFFHGKQSQQVVADAYLSAKVWAYPTKFSETFCITAIEAQSGGCVPVTSDYAGLKDTVGSGFKLDPDAYDYQIKFIEHVVAILTDDALFKAESNKAKKFAKKYTWESVVKQWEEIFSTPHSMVPLLPVGKPDVA